MDTTVIDDFVLAKAVESFYARKASVLTPEERALLANAVKLIRVKAVG